MANEQSPGTAPWGRLVPQRSTAPDAAPSCTNTPGWELTREEYTIGRSPTCDIPLVAPAVCCAASTAPSRIEREQWAHGMISNRHCRLRKHTDRATGLVVVLLEDTSANGSYCSQPTRRLRKGQSHVLHAGDEICLINPDIVRRNVPDPLIARALVQEFTFVFMDLRPPPLSTQQSMDPSQATQVETLTQNLDLTQMGDDGDGDDDGLASTIPPPFSPSPQRSQPWGRLISSIAGREASDLYPRSPLHKRPGTNGITILGLHHIQPCDLFNEYFVGRSPECDIRALKPENLDHPKMDPSERTIQEWAHGMISNKHCRIYCCLDDTQIGMQVFVEDTSANGTVVNQNVLLRKGERRILHSGDEICLVHAQTLGKKIRSKTKIQKILQQHSFIFVNVQQQHRLTQPLYQHNQVQPAHIPLNGTHHCHHHQQQQPYTSSGATPWVVTMTTTTAAAGGGGGGSANQRRTAVNPRAMRRHSMKEGVGSSIMSPPIPLVSNNCRRQQRRIEEDYDVRDLLGSGTTGQVRRAIHRITGEERAVKIINCRTGTALRKQLPPLEAEAAILRQLKHPYVVKLIDVYTSVDGSTFYIVMELQQGGDLFDRIVEKGKYSEIESRQVMRRLLSVVHYLHQDCNIVHRDLKPENILLGNKLSCIDVKLTDFGLAKCVSGNGLKTFCGTPQYFAPEVLKRQTTVMGQGRYGKPADMWSLGVILYVLLSGTPPFDEGQHALSTLDFPPEHWSDVSDDARDLIRTLLVADPRHRCTVQQACEHRWILTEDGDTHVHPLQDPAVQCVLNSSEAAEISVDDDSFTPIIPPPTNSVSKLSRDRDHDDDACDTTFSESDSKRVMSQGNLDMDSQFAKRDECFARPASTERIACENAGYHSSNEKAVSSLLPSAGPREYTSTRCVEELSSKSRSADKGITAIELDGRFQSNDGLSDTVSPARPNELRSSPSRLPLSPVRVNQNQVPHSPFPSTTTGVKTPTALQSFKEPYAGHADDANTCLPAPSESFFSLYLCETNRTYIRVSEERGGPHKDEVEDEISSFSEKSESISSYSSTDDYRSNRPIGDSNVVRVCQDNCLLAMVSGSKVAKSTVSRKRKVR